MISKFKEAIDIIQTERYSCSLLYLDISRWNVVLEYVSPFRLSHKSKIILKLCFETRDIATSGNAYHSASHVCFPRAISTIFSEREVPDSIPKSNLYYTLYITSKCVTSMRGPIYESLRPRNTAFLKEMSQPWRVVGNSTSTLTDLRFKTQISSSAEKRVKIEQLAGVRANFRPVEFDAVANGSPPLQHFFARTELFTG